jgi:signal transduction histidine kinase/ActR/RegA family two-component response regulator
MIYPILGKIKDKFTDIFILLAVTIVCFIVNLFIFPEFSSIQKISSSTIKLVFQLNLSTAIALVLLFSYLIYQITENNEKALTKAKILAEESSLTKMQFLSNMSHELRTPLNGIIGATNLLNLETLSPQLKEHIVLLKYSSSHMLNLVNDVLDFSKIESGKLELEKRIFNFEIFIKNIYNSFIHQFDTKHLYFKLDADDNLNFNIISDDSRLGQILNNLLSNALKFTEKGGVTLTIKATDINENTVRVSFVVSDTGIGISANKQDKVFDSFTQADLNTTRKYGGTGLGLTISKELAKAFNSELMLTSKLNEGSVFNFEILFNKSNEILANTAIVVDYSNSLNGVKILLAEDNKINMLIARKFLNKWGVIVTEAHNGAEAVKVFKEKNNFDIVLLDLEMPELDGHGALKEIKKINSAVPIIAFTAAIFENIDNTLIEKGFSNFVLKPFLPAELHTKLSQALHSNTQK